MSIPMRVSSNTLGENFTVHYQYLTDLIGGCPLELLESGGFRQNMNGDRLEPSECVHRRLAGDACPSQNWPHSVPCTCWEGK